MLFASKLFRILFTLVLSLKERALRPLTHMITTTMYVSGRETLVIPLTLSELN